MSVNGPLDVNAVKNRQMTDVQQYKEAQQGGKPNCIFDEPNPNAAKGQEEPNTVAVANSATVQGALLGGFAGAVAGAKSGAGKAAPVLYALGSAIAGLFAKPMSNNIDSTTKVPGEAIETTVPGATHEAWSGEEVVHYEE